jgi:hypothetical protein
LSRAFSFASLDGASRSGRLVALSRGNEGYYAIDITPCQELFDQFFKDKSFAAR